MKRIAPFHGLTLVFLIALSLLTLLFLGEIPLWRSLIFRYISLIGLLFGLRLLSARKPMGRWVTIFSYFSPVIFVILIYDSLGDLIQYLHQDIDPCLIRIDLLIFGLHPTVWMERWIVPWLTDIMSLAYLSYYFLPVTLAVVLYSKDRMAEFHMAIFVLAFGYYLSFIGYILFPAIGPRFTLTHLQTVPLEGSFLTDLVRDGLNTLEHNKRDCMPSGHTQIVLMVLYLAHRQERPLFSIFLPVICALILSTVYLRYHYVIDLFAGTAMAVACIIIGPRLYVWWNRSYQAPQV